MSTVIRAFTLISTLILVAALLPACSGTATVSASTRGVSADATLSTEVGVSASASATAGGSVGVSASTGAAGGTYVAGTCVEEWVHMPVLINFPTGGTEMDYQSRAVLDELVRSASNRTDLRMVRVEGHTDRCGHEANNLVLSQQRAELVALELVRLGVPRERIQTVGYGSQQPRANDNCDRAHELSRATNRRVEFSLLVCRGAH